jgi:DNA-binding NarL/FixJ family response regulator/class 3 adenylate cyclase
MGASPEPAETLTVVIAEVEGSAPLLERFGEERYLALQAELETLLGACADEHGGTREQGTGTGRVLAFRSARAAVRCAVAVQRAVAAGSLPSKVRAAIHSGELERHDGELRGRAMVKAARLAALARGGEILASSLVRELADLEAADVWFDDAVEVELRGLRGRHLVVPVRWQERARPPVRVVIADDAAIVRDGVAALLREHGFEVVATVSDAPGLYDAVDRHRPDVVVVDIRMPPTYTNEGVLAASRIRAEHPGIGVLVLSQHVEAEYALRLVRDAEARSGYLLKDRISEADILVDAVERVARGSCVVDPGLTEQLLRRAEAGGALADLTEREREVLALLAQGLTNRAIAERLVVTGRTVETHIGQIFSKLGLREEGGEHRRVAAVLTYLRAYPAG